MGLNRTGDRSPGRGMALAGIILGGIGIVVSIVALPIAILLPALGAARRMQNSVQLQGIHQAMLAHASNAFMVR